MTGAAWSSRSPARRFVRVLSRYLACVSGMEDKGNVPGNGVTGSPEE